MQNPGPFPKPTESGSLTRSSGDSFAQGSLRGIVPIHFYIPTGKMSELKIDYLGSVP